MHYSNVLKRRLAEALRRRSARGAAPERALAARPDIRRWRVEAVNMLQEIRAVADAMAATWGLDGESGFGRHAHWSLLRALERIRGTPSIADLARALHISRQSAHELVHRAARDGWVEVLENPRDRRIRQVRATAEGRSALAEARDTEAGWAIVLLNGLDRRTIRETSHILRVLRWRLLARRS